MGWFKKKEEDIPQLPELPSIDEDLPSLPYEQEPASPPGLDVEINELPNLPADDRGFSGSFIKDAIEHPEMQRSMISKKLIKAEPIPMIPYFEKRTKKIEPIYIRLDKFETTAESFEEIKKKITEIEKLLGKIKEIKSQEEKELEEWEQEIQAIKARIDYIDKSVFNKLD